MAKVETVYRAMGRDWPTEGAAREYARAYVREAGFAVKVFEVTTFRGTTISSIRTIAEVEPEPQQNADEVCRGCGTYDCGGGGDCPWACTGCQRAVPTRTDDALPIEVTLCRECYDHWDEATAGGDLYRS